MINQFGHVFNPSCFILKIMESQLLKWQCNLKAKSLPIHFDPIPIWFESVSFIFIHAIPWNVPLFISFYST